MVMPILDVQDIERSIEFYQQALGFDVTMTMPSPSGGISFAIVNLGEINIGLSLSAENQPEGKRGLGVKLNLYLPSDWDLDLYYEERTKLNIDNLGHLDEKFWGDRSFDITDPDGYALVLSQTPQLEA